jgi:hypothetical protein
VPFEKFMNEEKLLPFPVGLPSLGLLSFLGERDI